MDTAASAPPVLADPPARRFGTGRVLLLVFGSITLLVALAVLAAGGAAVWALTQRDGAGYFTSGAHRLSTGSYALATDNLDVGADAPGWIFHDHFATVRIEASGSRPVFIGIARTSAVDRYLAGVRHDQLVNLDLDPFSVDYRRQGGSAQPAPPAGERFWRVQASGPGRQTISWPLEKGNWSAVAMNADGTRGVSVEARFGARVPYLRWAAIGLLAGGGLVLLLGSGLIYLGARAPRTAVKEA
jgi:hypothetical protein